MLILLGMGQKPTIKDYLYSEMVFFLKDKFPASEVYEYISDEALIQKVKEENHKRIIIPRNVSKIDL